MTSGNVHLNCMKNYGEDYSPRRGKAPEGTTKRIALDGAYVTEDAEQQEQLHEERLNRRIAEVNQARAITRLSPVTIVQNLLESFAGTGFERHLQFLENVQTYVREFRIFIVDTESADSRKPSYLRCSDGYVAEACQSGRGSQI